MFKFPKNDAKYAWTNHVARKMMFYGLSVNRIKRVVRNPKRSEKGVAPETIALMQPSSAKAPAGKAWKEEVWVMYAQKQGNKNPKTNIPDFGKKVIITAWRYPGISPIRDEIPIPADILEELRSIKY